MSTLTYHFPEEARTNPGYLVFSSRQRMGLTVKRLAELSGVSDYVITHIEQGYQGTKLDILIRIFRNLDIPLSDYVGFMQRIVV